MRINLEREFIRSEILNGLKKFEKDTVVIERRKNPLTEEWCRINESRGKRIHQVRDHLLRMESSGKACRFCSENIDNLSNFPPDLIPEGKIIVGDFILFPNQFPFGEYHAVGILCKEHFLEINKWGSKIWENCFKGCIEFFELIVEKNPNVRFASINLNHLPYAGASIIHPHIQVLVDAKPTVMLDLYLKKSFEYFIKNKSNYWLDLIETEKEIGQRFIGETGSVSWLASFAPTWNDEVIGIINNKSSFFELQNSQIKDICTGLEKILKGLYEERGIRSINMVVFSAPLKENSDEFFSLNLKIISRSPTSTWAFSEIIHREPIISTLPEDVAKDLRDFLSD
jgi:galactose-1-phosphate uridylyltransferase